MVESMVGFMLAVFAGLISMKPTMLLPLINEHKMNHKISWEHGEEHGVTARISMGTELILSLQEVT